MNAILEIRQKMEIITLHNFDLRERGQGFCDDITKAFRLESVTMGEGGSQIFHFFETSFIDDL